MDRGRAVYFSQEEQVVIIKSYKEFKNQITAKGNTVAHNKASEACWQKTADRVISLKRSEKNLHIVKKKITMLNAKLIPIE